MTTIPSRTVADTDHQALARWAADCAEHVLPYFETHRPDDDRPRLALESARAWARAEIRCGVARVAAVAAHAAARAAVEGPARAAARAAGHAAATAHMAAHARHAAAYAATAAPVPEAEREWQARRLPKHLRPVKALVIAALVSAPAAAQTLPTRSDVAITHVTVIDVTTGQRLADRTILVVGNRIHRVGVTAAVRVPAGMRVVDATGKFVIPGLWDMHVHTVSHALDFPMEVANGITGVRDMGGSTQYPPPGNWGVHFDSLRAWRSAIRAGVMIGPRVMAGGVALDGPEPIWPQPLSIKTADQGRRVVDSLHDAGVDFIKVYGRLPNEILVAIADQARSVGLPFAGHLSSFTNVASAAALGQRSIEHANALEASYLDGEAIQASRRAADLGARGAAQAVEPGERVRQMSRLLATFDSARLERAAKAWAGTSTWSDPTLVALRSLALPFHRLTVDSFRLVAYTPQQIRDVWSARMASTAPAEMVPVLEHRLRLWEHGVRATARQGVRLLVGSDAWNPYVMPGFGLHDEMELLALQGIPPLKVLRAATLGAAQFLGLSDSLGTVAPGKLADLVLLDGDPVRDIQNVRRVHSVILDGRLLVRHDLDALLAGARTAATGTGPWAR